MIEGGPREDGTPAAPPSLMSLMMMATRANLESSSTRREEARPRPRIRERALGAGVESLTDRELVALLVERGTPFEPLGDRVERLFREAGGLAGLSSRGVAALAEELGLGIACAARIGAAIELGTRVVRLGREPPGEAASSATDVERWGRAHLVDLPHEELWALLLDGRNRILGERMIARGGLHACAITARDVLRPIVREAAGAFVLVHNHPGGDPCPSREDLVFTRAVALGASTLGVTLIDHVVVARDGSVSMLEAGLFDEVSP